MKRVKIAELKNQLSKHLRAVERGAEIEVTDRDRAIARIVPIAEEAVAIGVDEAEVPFTAVRRRPRATRRLGVDLVEILLEDREKGRR